MKVTILNGNPSSENRDFDGYLERLSDAWEVQGHQVSNLELRSMDIAYCTGCWGCCTPGPMPCAGG